MTPRYSIIVVSYNSLAHLQATLEAARLCLAAEPGGADCGEIVVVDNASRDGTGAWLKAQPWLKAILNTDNRGFSAACNQGAAESRGEFLLFLNPDTWATPGCLGRMAKQMGELQVGAVGPLSNYVAGLQRIDAHWPGEAGSLESLPGLNARGKAESIASGLAHYRHGQGVDTRLLIGFCLMMRRDLYRNMGGMDEDLFLGNDDLDLSWRLREKGFRLRVAVDAFVWHEGQKSFQTEPKEKMNRLVQESTDALYRKLVRHYGSPGAVPSPMSLWGMDWFKPSAAAVEAIMKSSPQTLIASTPSVAEMSSSSFLADVTLVIPMPAGEGGEEALRASLDVLPEELGEVILLDTRITAAALPDNRKNVRRLDVGSDMPLGLAMRLVSRAAQKPYLLCLPAGLQLTALFSHWLARRYPQDLPSIMPLRISEAEGPWSGKFNPWLIQRETWLREPPSPDADWQGVGEDLKSRAAKFTQPQDAPWLGCTREARNLWITPPKVETTSPGQDWSPVAGDPRISFYPESLQSRLRDANQAVFVGTATGAVNPRGPLCGVDMNGKTVDLRGQDLVILRLTPDMIPDLADRLRHLRRCAPELRRLVTLFNGQQALKVKGDEKGWHVPIDLTEAGITTALRLAGFSVLETKPYRGFPDPQIPGGTLQGWHQIEAEPRRPITVLARKVSIVILGFNQMDYTRKCIESIRKHTRQKYELVLVDNGSQDGTWDLFRSIPGAKAVRNASNLGVAAGWNRGLHECDGDYICILNNDTLVGENWLENMIRLCESDTRIGMVGPRSNRVAGPQMVGSVAYRQESEIADYIATWNSSHDLQSEDHDWVKGVCMVMPKSVVDQVGYFDERFGKGNFEDDDYCLRVRLHGFRTCVAHDSFLHHFGSVSFNQEGIDWTAQMRKNQVIFETKWARGREALNDVVVETKDAPVTKDEMSVRMALVLSAYESGDLMKARHSLLEAAALDSEHPEVLNAMGIFCFHDGEPREAALCFLRALIKTPAHEDAARNLIDALNALNGEVSSAEMTAFHRRFPNNPIFVGVEAAPDWRRDVEGLIAIRDFHAAITQVSGHMQEALHKSACFNFLGIIAHELDQAEEAIGHFRRALGESPVEKDAVLNLVEALLSVENLTEAQAVLKNGMAGKYPGLEGSDYGLVYLQIRKAAEKTKPDIIALVGDMEAGEKSERLLESGQPEAARAFLLEHVKLSPEDFRAHNNLGLCAYYAGQTESALAAFEQAMRCEPGFGDALINACDCAITLGKVEGIPEWVRRALTRDPALPEGKRMEKLWLREGENLCQGGSLAEVETLQTLVEQAEAKLREGNVAGAKRLYEEVLSRRALHAQAMNGLGIIAFQEQSYEVAYRRFQEAVRLNPSDQDALINLWESARAQRREDEALGLLRHSLDRYPGLTEVRAIVSSVA